MQALSASALVLLVVGLLTNYLLQLKRSVVLTELSEAADQIAMDANISLFSIDSCRATFTPLGPLSANPPVLKIVSVLPSSPPISMDIFVIGFSYYTSRVILQAMSISNYTLFGPPPNTGTFKLNMDFALPENIVGLSVIRRSFDIRVNVDAAQVVTDCYAMGFSEFDERFIPQDNTGKPTNKAIRTGGLQINGDLIVEENPLVANSGTIATQFFAQTSDERVKNSISRVSKLGAKLENLSGYNFIWRSNSKKESGLVAQEVEQIFPEFIHQEQNSNIKSVSYNSIISVLLSGISEESDKVSLMQNNLDRTQAKLNTFLELNCKKWKNDPVCQKYLIGISSNK